MVNVKILDEEKYNGRIIFFKKLIMYKAERAGDRIRIFTYYTDVNGEKPEIKYNYMALDQEECITIFELMQEEL